MTVVKRNLFFVIKIKPKFKINTGAFLNTFFILSLKNLKIVQVSKLKIKAGALIGYRLIIDWLSIINSSGRLEG